MFNVHKVKKKNKNAECDLKKKSYTNISLHCTPQNETFITVLIWWLEIYIILLLNLHMENHIIILSRIVSLLT